jgi:hypothetical protein
MLFSLMRAVHGDQLVVSLNAQALTGDDESNDLTRLKHARLALCSFESAHHADGSYQPNTLKSITSGGANSISVRAKYAREAEDIYYRGSLWLYGNKVPNLTGSGDVDGIDRRFTIVPMRRRLPQTSPPTGFNSWPDAVRACAPVFAHRCLLSYMAWRAGGSKGFMDARQRVPEAWKRITEEHLLAGSRFGFLRDLFFPNGDNESCGLYESTIYDLMDIVLRSEKITRWGRSKFPGTLHEMMSKRCHFDGMGKLETIERDGKPVLPLMVNPDILERLLSGNAGGALAAPLLEAKRVLHQDPWYNEEMARHALEMNDWVNGRGAILALVNDEEDQGDES